MTFKRQIPVEIHTPGSIERILTMVFDHWIGHMGSDIMKTITRNPDILQLTIVDIRKTCIDPLNPINLAIHCPKRISAEIEAGNGMPTTIGFEHNIRNQSAVSPHKNTLLVIDKAEKPNPTS